MKERDKIGFLCLMNVLAISIFYLESDFNIIISSIMFFVGMLSVGIITLQSQKKTKNEN